MDVQLQQQGVHSIERVTTPRARALAKTIKRTWEDFTDDERRDVLAIVNEVHGSLDRLTIEKMIAAAHGNLTIAAEMLGIGRRTLQRKMRAFDIPIGKSGPKQK